MNEKANYNYIEELKTVSWGKIDKIAVSSFCDLNRIISTQNKSNYSII